jgi:hypothetical protein
MGLARRPMPQSLDPFISAQDVVDYLGRGVASDPGLVLATDAACDTVRTFAERTFNQIVGGTVILDGTGTDALVLPEQPVTAAGTVLVNGSQITDYMLTQEGVLLRGTAGGEPRPVWPCGRQNVTVVCDHGYATVDFPRDVKMVALALASRLVVQGVTVSETVGDVSVSYAGPATDLTKGEQMILRKYRQSRSF